MLLISVFVCVTVTSYRINRHLFQTTTKQSVDKNKNFTLANLKDFHFNLNDMQCDDNVFLMFVVPSHPDHANQRKILREAYNREIRGKTCRVVFLLGLIADSTQQKIIIQENFIFKDIIQGSFVDSYRNVTYNHLQGLLWGTEYCSQADYVVKADDDIYVNVPNVITFLTVQDSLTMKMFCALWFDAPPMRNPTSKYYVSQDEYPDSKYPAYCNGWVVVYPTDVARTIVRVAAKTKFFWMSDVYITGVVVKSQGSIRLVDMNPFYTYSVGPLYEWLKNGKMLPVFYAGTTGKDTKLLEDLYRKTYRIAS